MTWITEEEDRAIIADITMRGGIDLRDKLDRWLVKCGCHQLRELQHAHQHRAVRRLIASLPDKRSIIRLKRCPCCGGKATSFKIFGDSAPRFKINGVQCTVCQMQTGLYLDRKSARFAWNRRTT